ncbi:MAG: hypothetical protein FJ291_01445 [Planctomycetes bacterium]|nr:hypothetical protein [Planctomycetota bacterium]
MSRIAAFMAAVGLASALAGEQAVWQIGKPDRSYAEFALARDYQSFPKRFGAKPLVFEVGKSDAAKDWPWIHPGPSDAWAGHRVYPFKIRFELADEPKGLFTLRIELANTHYGQPPTYSVAVGDHSGQFRLPIGGTDASLTDPAAGKPHKIEIPLPPGILRKGANEVTLACTEGSWALYDAITLLTDPEGKMPEPGVASIAIAPTPFHVKVDGKVRRAIDVNIGLTAPAQDITLRVEAGGETTDVPVKQQLATFGGISQEVGVPDSSEPMEVKVTATVAGRSKTATVKLEPVRKWRIFVAPSSHTDIGYTHIQPQCAEIHNKNADIAADLMDKFPDFKWNLEVAWQAENYLASRKGEQLDKFLKYAKEGRMGVQALYNNILTGLCSHEEACRLTYFAHSLKTRYGIPFKSAMISDVPSQEATIPMILANSGIRYFSSGINNTRGPLTAMYAKAPCWWEGPDGSRVLMMYVPGYAHAGGWGLDASVERARGHILGAIKGYEARKDYPYDAIFLHGAVSDNVALNPRLADVCKAWNDRYEFPKVILCHNAEFFEHIEKSFGDKLPVVKGSAGTYWEDGAGSSARETALNRNAHEATRNAETLFALARRVNPNIAYPAEAIAAAWRNCLLYDEHTWGAHCSISQPDSDFTKAQWKIKSQFALDADKAAKDLAVRSHSALARLVKTDASAGLVVINPTSWPRTQVIGASNLVSVPALGYRVLLRQDMARPPKSETLEGTVIESKFYRVSFDEATGAITSIFDKELNRELVDPKAPYRLNQYLYVAGGEGTRIVENGPEPKLTIGSQEKAGLRRSKFAGDLGERMVVETSAPMSPMVVNEVYVLNDVKRVDIVNRVTKTQTYKKEAVYFAFPFAAEKPTFRYEVPCGIVNANTDMLPTACLDWFTVQHFVEVEAPDVAIAWATPDAPLVCFQDINRGKWLRKLDFTNGHIYAYVMNNYWFTNYLAGQGGDFTFRFSITSRPKSDPVASARFGWEVASPLVAVSGPANPAGVLTESSGSLIEIAEPNVFLVGAKKAEASDALVLRLWEVSGKATTAHVRIPLLKPKKATAASLVEEPQGELELKDYTIAIPIRASGLATALVE